MRVPPGIQVPPVVPVHLVADPFRHIGRIGISPLEGDELVRDVFGIGIFRRQGHPSRLDDSQQVQISPVLPVGLGVHGQHHVGHSVLGRVIGKESGIPGPPVVVPAVEEMRAVGYLRAAADPHGEHGLQHGIAPALVQKHYADVVILDYPAHVRIGQTVLYQDIAVVKRSQGRYHRVGCQRTLDAPELYLQSNVAVHRQAVPPNVNPVLFLAETKQRRGRYKVDGHHHGVKHPSPKGECVDPDSGKVPQGGGGKLHQQRERKRERQE